MISTAMSTMQCTTSITVGSGSTVLLRWLLTLADSVVNAYLIAHCGLRPTSSSTIGLCVRSESSYFKPVEFPAKLDLGLSVAKLGKTSVTYEIGVFEAGKDEV